MRTRQNSPLLTEEIRSYGDLVLLESSSRSYISPDHTCSAHPRIHHYLHGESKYGNLDLDCDAFIAPVAPRAEKTLARNPESGKSDVLSSEENPSYPLTPSLRKEASFYVARPTKAWQHLADELLTKDH